MTLTYNDTMPTSRDQVRFITGDTDGYADAYLSDNELDYILEGEPNITKAAIIAVERLLARYATLADNVSLDGISYSFTNRQDQLRTTLTALKAKVGSPLPRISQTDSPRLFTIDRWRSK